VLVNGEVAGTSTENPVTISVTGLPPGTYALTARATDDKGDVGESEPVGIEVLDAPNPPTLSNPEALPSQSDFQNFGFTITGQAGAEYVVEGTSDFMTWTPVKSGTMPSASFQETLPRVVGGRAQFYRVRVGGEIPPPNKPPVVAITQPEDGQSFTAPATIEIVAEASDEDGQVVRVEIYEQDRLIGSSEGDTARLTFGDIPQGAYTFRARAIDDKGLAGQSEPVSVEVTGSSDAPKLEDPEAVPSNTEFEQFRFSVALPVGTDYRIEASANLVDWETAEQGKIATTPQQFSFPRSGSSGHLYYRLALP